jgi:trans-aconitate methyltransferase
MPGADHEYRLYGELAGWWPLISPPGEYTQEATYLAAVLSSTAAIPVHDVLDLGSGGGHVAMHLKDRFTLTLADISGDMLDVSGRLNPQCRHVRGDMRTMRLGQQFDAVLTHDAIDYVTSRADLAMVIATAFEHCRPGGIAVFVPDYVKDDFRALTGGGGGGEDETGRKATFRERTWDPDPADDWVQAEYEFILREADGTVDVVKETHRLGVFARETWRQLLVAAGFLVGPGLTGGTGFANRSMPGKSPANLFIGHRGLRSPS